MGKFDKQNYVDRMDKYPAGRPVKNLLPSFLKKIQSAQCSRSCSLNDVWSEIIGEKYAQFTKIDKYDNGMLFISVTSSSLLNMLTMMDKSELIDRIKEKLTSLQIKNIVFKRL